MAASSSAAKPPSSVEIFTPARWLKGLFALSLAFLLGMDAIGLLVLLEEGWGVPVLILGSIGLLITGLNVYILWHTLQTVSLDDEHLVVRQPLGRVEVSAAAITAVEHGDRLRIHTATRTLSLYFPTRPLQADVAAALERRLPALAAASRRRLAADLPLVIGRRRSQVWTNLSYFVFFGLGLIALGGRGLWYAANEALQEGWLDSLLAGLTALLMIGVGLLMAWLFLFRFVWRYTFGPDEMILRTPASRRVFAVADLQEMALGHEIRRFRGIPRDAYFLEFTFSGGRSFRVEPTENGVPSAFSPKKIGGRWPISSRRSAATTGRPRRKKIHHRQAARMKVRRGSTGLRPSYTN